MSCCGVSDPVLKGSIPTVLVVDDLSSICELFEEFCCDNYRVMSVSDGSTAIAMLTQNRVDIIISDWRMPAMSGIEFLKQAARLQPDAVRILMTGNVDGDILIDAVNHGHINFFLRKPFHLSEARALLRQANEYGIALSERRGLIQQMEQLNRELEKRVERGSLELESAQRLAHVGSWTWVPQTDFVNWSEELYRIAGRDPKVAAPTHAEQSQLWTPESWVRLTGIGKKAMQAGIPYEVELEMVRPDNTRRWVLTTGEAERDAGGRVVRHHGTVQDITERKQAEEALQRSERRAREHQREIEQMYKYSPVGLCLYDRSLRFVRINERMADIDGLPVDQHLGRSIREVLPDLADKIRDSILPVLECGETVTDVEIKGNLPGSDGEGHWLVNYYPFRSETGEVIGVSAAVLDITVRRQAEEALRKTSEKYRLALEAAGLGTWEYNFDTASVYRDLQSRKMCGIEAGSNPAKATAHVHPDDRAYVKEAIEQALAGRDDGAYDVEYRTISQEGDIHWISGHGRVYFEGPIAQLKAVRFIGVNMEITERKRTEATLRSSEEALEHRNRDLLQARDSLSRALEELRKSHQETEFFLSAVPSLLIGLNADGVITMWNPAAGAIFGLSSDEACGKTLGGCGVVWVGSDPESEIRNSLSPGANGRIEHLPFLKDGETRILALRLARVHTGENAEGVLIAGADITERLTLETQLRQAQKLEAIGQLAAGVAHEINTPTQYVGDNTAFIQHSWKGVSTMIENCKRMRQEAESGRVSHETLAEFDTLCEDIDVEYVLEEVPRALTQSLDGIQRVSKIVRAMKEFSHPGLEVKKAIDINHAIETTITVARNEWKYVAEIQTQFDPTIPFVPCLPGEINQVILNLLVNAAHAIGAGQEDTAKKGTIAISTRRDGEWAEIAVGDSGIGIPEEIRNRIFEPFFTTKEIGKGTGQGLALAYNAIVKRHGGQIWFESEVGKGTIFYVRLPLNLAE